MLFTIPEKILIGIEINIVWVIQSTLLIYHAVDGTR